MFNHKFMKILLFLALLFLAGVAPVSALEASVDPLVLEDTAGGQTAHFLVVLRDQADTRRAAAGAQDRLERTTRVYQALRRVADSSQPGVIAQLEALGASYRPYWITNLIAVVGDRTVVEALAARPDVQAIEPDRAFHVDLEKPQNAPPSAPQGIEWNISRVHAPEVWALGYTGQGTVYANADTGVQWDHPALKPQYRGWDGAQADHNYNWWDAIHEDIDGDGYNPCGYNLQVPCDDYGHGTHTTGTGVGDDGGSNQIGMAPGARWIGCRNMEDGTGRPETYIECMQFFLAPTDLNGQNPDPSLSPDVVGNSYGCPPSELCSPHSLQASMEALRAAGIFMSVSAGNSGSFCETITDPPALEDSAITVGATGQDNNNTIADFSSRGPVTVDGFDLRKPDLAAPGVNIRSSVPGGGYEGGWSGTSMASPHVAGAVALLWSAVPEMRGDVDGTELVLEETALHQTSNQGCGGDGPNDVPNNVYGYGTIDALAAVELAIEMSGSGALDGYITSENSGEPITWATVEAVGDKGRDYSAATDASGYYTTTLIVDTYTVTASAYGYISQVVTDVQVITDTVTPLDFHLSEAPTYLLTGTVTEAGTGLPLHATITFDEAPVSTQTDPATGSYEIGMLPGSYTMHVTAMGHVSAVRSIVIDEQPQQQDFSLELLPCILLVDDDQDSPNVQSYYTYALDGLDYSYQVWDLKASGDPSQYDLQGYNTVLWYTGAPESKTLTTDNEQAIMAYLNAGGNLLLSSEGYLSEADLEGDFLKNYLGIAAFEADTNFTNPVGTSGDPIGDGLGPYSLIKPPGWSSLKTDSASGVLGTPFQWFGQGGEGNSARYDGADFKTVFLGWPAEAISRLTDREAVLSAVQNYFGNCAAPQGTLSGKITNELSGELLQGATVTAQPGDHLAVTDDQGAYTLDLPAGSYTVTAEATNFVSQTVTQAVLAGDVTTLDFQLEPARFIVVDPASLSSTLTAGETSTATLTVRNAGGGELQFSITGPLVEWLTISPMSGTVPVGESLALAVTFDAGPLAAGVYDTAVEINSNDPANPLITVPVELIVTQNGWKVFLPLAIR